MFWSKTLDPKALPNLQGKVALVTGANSGIGYQTALHLARTSCKVYIASRNEVKGLGAVSRIRAELAKEGRSNADIGDVEYVHCDLSTIKGAREAAVEFLDRQGKEGRLDLLINNAGILAKSFGLSADGISDVMATNHIGVFVLTTTLLPLLRKTASEPGSDVRIVSVSSEAHRLAPWKLSFDNIDDLNIKIGTSQNSDFVRYGISKLLAILFTTELQRRLDNEKVPITAICLHPGVVMTEGGQRYFETLPFSFLWLWIMTLFVMTSFQGSKTTLFAATSPLIQQKPEVYRGAYLVPYDKVRIPTGAGNDKKLAEDLWNTSENIVAGSLEK